MPPSKPVQLDCDRDHKVSVQDDKNIRGVLSVHNCKFSRFGKRPERGSKVGTQYTSIINARLAKAGIKDQHTVNIVKTSGNDSVTEFEYTVPCAKANHQTVINTLKDACKDKSLTDTINQEKQREEGDSSSESHEHVKSQTQKSTAAPTTKSTAAPTPKPTEKATEKTTQKDVNHPTTKQAATAAPTQKSTEKATTKQTAPGKLACVCYSISWTSRLDQSDSSILVYEQNAVSDTVPNSPDEFRPLSQNIRLHRIVRKCVIDI